MPTWLLKKLKREKNLQLLMMRFESNHTLLFSVHVYKKATSTHKWALGLGKVIVFWQKSLVAVGIHCEGQADHLRTFPECIKISWRSVRPTVNTLHIYVYMYSEVPQAIWCLIKCRPGSTTFVRQTDSLTTYTLDINFATAVEFKE
jgi:hypothetical protein